MKPAMNQGTSEHQAFQDDGQREHDGYVTELTPREGIGAPLEDQIIGLHGRLAEDDMKMLLKGGGL